MKQFFTDSTGALSMKRLCGFIITISICIKLITTTNDALIYVAGGLATASLGLTTAEKIYKPKTQTNEG